MSVESRLREIGEEVVEQKGRFEAYNFPDKDQVLVVPNNRDSVFANSVHYLVGSEFKPPVPPWVNAEKAKLLFQAMAVDFFTKVWRVAPNGEIFLSTATLYNIYS